MSFHHRRVQERLVALEIEHPQRVRTVRGEDPFDQIRWPGRPRIRSGGEHPPTPTHPTGPGLTHQPANLIATVLMTGPTHCLGQLARPVHLVVRGEHCQHDRVHRHVANRSSRRCPCAGGVISGRSDLQHITVRLGSELFTMSVDELDAVDGRAPPRKKLKPTARSRSPDASPAPPAPTRQDAPCPQTSPPTDGPHRYRPTSPTNEPTRSHTRAAQRHASPPYTAPTLIPSDPHQTNRLLFLHHRVPPRRRPRLLLCTHNSIPDSKNKSLHQTQGDSDRLPSTVSRVAHHRRIENVGTRLQAGDARRVTPIPQELMVGFASDRAWEAPSERHLR